MRRNTVTLLKYLLFAVVFMIFGPFLLRTMFGGQKQEIDALYPQQGGMGLPEDPESMKRKVSQCSGGNEAKGKSM